MPLSGAITKQTDFHRSQNGVLSFNGNLGSTTKHFKSLSGVLSFAGNLTSFVGTLSVGGVLGIWSGIVSLKKNGVPVGKIAKAIINQGGSWVRLLSRGIYNGK